MLFIGKVLGKTNYRVYYYEVYKLIACGYCHTPEDYTDLEKTAFNRTQYWYPDGHYSQMDTLLLVDPKHCKLKISEADDQE